MVQNWFIKQPDHVYSKQSGLPMAGTVKLGGYLYEKESIKCNADCCNDDHSAGRMRR